MNNKKIFALTGTLTVLAVLGAFATSVIPSTILSNKTIKENHLKTSTAFTDWSNNTSYYNSKTEDSTEKVACSLKELKNLFNTSSANSKNKFEKCKANNSDICTVNGITYKKKAISYIKQCKDTIGDFDLQKYDRETGETIIGYCSEANNEEIYYAEIKQPSEKEATDAKNISSICKKCKHGDYYEAARIKCEQQGAKMANLAQLKALKKNVEPSGFHSLSAINNYWALEEHDTDYAHVVIGQNNTYAEKNLEFDFVCIGK